MFQKKILEAVKQALAKRGLNMYTADVRLAYIVYYIYVDDLNDYFNAAALARRAVSENNLPVSPKTLLRSAYRAIEKINTTDDKATVLHELATQVGI